MACAGIVPFAALAFATGLPAQAPASGGGLGTTAQYVLGFVQYVRWPAEDDIHNWTVCVPLAEAEASAGYADKSVRGRPVSVHPVRRGDSLSGCHVLDLTHSPTADERFFLDAARRLPILTVGHSESFCSTGGTVCLRTRGGGGFEINLSAAQQARLQVSAQLLMLGRRRPPEGSVP